MKILLVILLICGTASAQETTPKLDLMPVPSSVKFHPSERLNVNDSFKIATRGHSDDRLKAAIARFVKRLEGRTVSHSRRASRRTIR